MPNGAGGGTMRPSMSSPSLSLRVATRRKSPRGSTAARTAPPRDVPELAAEPVPALELDTISAQWQLALDAAERALRAAGGSLPASELVGRRRGLVRERQQTAQMLVGLARMAGVRPAPWLAPVPLSATMLGLPATARACVFDLEGVLTDSALLHAQAWSEAFDEFLLRLSDKTGWAFIPFDRGADYRTYLDGRPRLEGVHAFLDSRGIRLPEGRADDPAAADTACGLAARKGEALERGLRQQGVSALDGARRYLEAAGHAGLKRAVVSASASAVPMLERAGLATLLEERVDAGVSRAEGLRARPAPDLLLYACRRLGVRPEETVTFTHTPAGVAAGLAAGLGVIGVGEGARGEALLGFGAEHVIPSVGVLLDRILSPPTDARL